LKYFGKFPNISEETPEEIPGSVEMPIEAAFLLLKLYRKKVWGYREKVQPLIKVPLFAGFHLLVEGLLFMFYLATDTQNSFSRRA